MTTTQSTKLNNGEDLYIGDSVAFVSSTSLGGVWVVESISDDGSHVTARGTIARHRTPTEPVRNIERIIEKNEDARPKVTEDMLLRAPIRSVLTSGGLDGEFVKQSNGLWSNGRFDLSPEMILFFRADSSLTLTLPEVRKIVVNGDKLQEEIDKVQEEIDSTRGSYGYLSSNDLREKVRRSSLYKTALLRVREGEFS